jgi:hypothetical protein
MLAPAKLTNSIIMLTKIIEAMTNSIIVLTKSIEVLTISIEVLTNSIIALTYSVQVRRRAPRRARRGRLRPQSLLIVV